jgi:hypothetical protein
MTAGASIAVAAIFVWLGMVMAISFIEAPLKFRAPGVTPQIGLGIGRLVFRVLNTVETILAITLVIALAVGPPRPVVVVAVLLAVMTLAAQLLAVRPRLHRRSNAVLAGPEAPNGSSSRSRAHYAYVALDIVKVVALAVGGALLLAA